MPWYDVYDNVEVQLVTRKQAAAVSATVATVLVFSVACIAVGIDGGVPLSGAAAAALLSCTVLTWWLVRRIRKLRRIVWCVKLSPSEIIGYDYARRRRGIAWRDVQRIDITDDGVTVAAGSSRSLTIPSLFTEFPQVSHQVVARAERLNIPVFLNGRSLEQIDLYELFPFLSEDASSSPRGSATV